MPRALTLINILLGVAIIALLAAIAAEGLGRRLNVAPVSRSAGAGKPAPALLAARVEDLAFYAPILANGLFGKGTQGSLTPLVNALAAQGAVPVAAPAELMLLGTAVGSFRETFALVRNSAKQEERVFRLGDMVYDTGRLVEVTRERAFIVVGGKKVELMTPLSAPQAQSASPQAGVQVANMGGGNFVIDQRALNAALDNPAQAMSDARLLPSMKDGKVEGFRVSEIKNGGVFAMVGMKNGDILLRLNDFPVDSPDKALQSLVALKGQSRLKLDLVRDGQPATFNYDIR